MRPARGLSKTNCSRTSKWQSMITHCKESKWLPMEWIGGQRIMAEHRWKIDVWLGVITPLGGSLLIYPTNGKCFYSNEGVWRAKMTATGQRGAPPLPAATLLPNHNTHTHYQVFTNGQMYSPSALSAASHKLLRSRVSVLIDVLTKKKKKSHHRADILITCDMHFLRLGTVHREMDRLTVWAC